MTKTLRASPDLLGRFFKESRYSFAPRVQSAWRDNVQLVKKVRDPPPVGWGRGVNSGQLLFCFIVFERDGFSVDIDFLSILVIIIFHGCNGNVILLFENNHGEYRA